MVYILGKIFKDFTIDNFIDEKELRKSAII